MTPYGMHTQLTSPVFPVLSESGITRVGNARQIGGLAK